MCWSSGPGRSSVLRRWLAGCPALACFLCGLPASAVGQQIPRAEYLRYVPLEVPRIIRQTEASQRLSLYGDPESPEYVDVDPLDGMDDRRHAVLEELAVRFAPFLVQNTEMIPMDHEMVRDGPNALNVDSWNTAAGLDLVRQEAVDWMEVASDPCAAANPTADDCRLLELLEKYHPDDPGHAAGVVGERHAASSGGRVARRGG